MLTVKLVVSRQVMGRRLVAPSTRQKFCALLPPSIQSVKPIGDAAPVPLGL
jgi:hypothetical protein